MGIFSFIASLFRRSKTEASVDMSMIPPKGRPTTITEIDKEISAAPKEENKEEVIIYVVNKETKDDIDSFFDQDTAVDYSLKKDPVSAIKFYDLTKEQAYPIPKSKISGGKTVMREPKKITGITIHQTGISYSVNDKQLSDSGGDKDLAKARRFLNIPAHACVSHDGFWVVHSPLEAYLNHANTLNSSTLGIEIEGRYAGIEKNKTKEDRFLDSKTIEAAKEALKYLVVEGRKKGMPIEYIYAHRQSSNTRRADPGEAIWKEIVIKYAVDVLGLKTDCGYRTGSGTFIPLDWDPKNGIGKY